VSDTKRRDCSYGLIGCKLLPEETMLLSTGLSGCGQCGEKNGDNIED